MDLPAPLAWLVDEAGASPAPDRFLAELSGRLLADGLPLAGSALTLAVPLANGVQAGRAFFAHALVVLLVPPVLIVFVWATRRVVSVYPWRKVSAGSSPHARRAGSHAASVATTTSAPAPTT